MNNFHAQKILGISFSELFISFTMCKSIALIIKKWQQPLLIITSAGHISQTMGYQDSSRNKEFSLLLEVGKESFLPWRADGPLQELGVTELKAAEFSMLCVFIMYVCVCVREREREKDHSCPQLALNREQNN
jgi:hypothetical protein